MTTRTITMDSDELATLLTIQIGQTVDGLFKELPYFACYRKVYGESGLTKGGGRTMQANVEVREHSNLTGMPTGYEDIDLRSQGMNESLRFHPAFVTAPFVSSVVERAIYELDAESKAAIARRGQSVAAAVMRYAHQHFFQGGVAAFVTGGWGHLNGSDYTDGMVEEDAIGAQGNTIGELDKGTYSAVPAMQNYSYDFAGSVGDNGRLGFTHTNHKQKERVSDRSKVFDFASTLAATHLSAVMAPYVRYAKADSIDVLLPEFMINGRPVYVTSDLPNAGAATTAKPWSVLSLDLGAIMPVFLKNKEIDGMCGITPMDLQVSGNKRVNVGYIDFAGQMVCEGRLNSTALYVDGEAF